MPEQQASLATSDLDRPGISRRRCGRGFRYTWPDARTVSDQAAKERIRALAIPPAWTEESGWGTGSWRRARGAYLVKPRATPHAMWNVASAAGQG